MAYLIKRIIDESAGEVYLEHEMTAVQETLANAGDFSFADAIRFENYCEQTQAQWSILQSTNVGGDYFIKPW